jgi:GDP-L-fucose synthase
MRTKRIFVAGHKGMVGSAIVKELNKQGDVELVVREKCELDLMDQTGVRGFFEANRIDQVYLAAAKVGGIHANNVYPAEFIYQNLMIQANVIHSAYLAGVKKLLFLGSSCIYPRDSRQPIDESSLLRGYLEKTNEPYAIAKIAGIKLCESYSRQYGRTEGVDYRAIMPPNLYGPGDNFHPENSHVIPALIYKFHNAKQCAASAVAVWGTGRPLREFLYVDDLARASVEIMKIDGPKYRELTDDSGLINAGSGMEISIGELATLISQIVGFKGKIVFDHTKPDGTPRKLMCSDKLLSLGWKPIYDLQEGLSMAYEYFLNCVDRGVR